MIALRAILLLILLENSVVSASEQDATCQDTSCNVQDVFLVDGVPTGNDEQQTVTLLQKEPARFTKVPPEEAVSEEWLHIAANGDHEGWFVHVPAPFLSCHLELAMQLVAREIVASYEYDDESIRLVDLRGPHRLVDAEGRSFPQDSFLRQLHLLLPREAFIHKAVAEGHVRTLSDGVTTLTTLSLVPRVFLVDPILSSTEECEELIQISSQTLRKSPEKHYSDAYKNYRTSWTGSTPGDAPLTQRLWQKVQNITRMPNDAVEFPQLLKYDTNVSWYKEHHDFYHNFESRPLEEVRMFILRRAQELVRLNVIAKDHASPFQALERLDRIDRGPMTNTFAEKLVQQLELASSDADSRSPQRQLHDFLVHSNEPIRDWTRVVLLHASNVLRANGATDPESLANKYFQLEGVKRGGDAGNFLPFHYLPNDYVPYVIKPVQNNRHATVLPVLRAADRGGNTAFPLSQSKGMEPDVDEEFAECTNGLIVKAGTNQALLFYNRLPRGDLDYNSIHAGCPPKEGEKFAVNCFTWDYDAWWAFKFLTEIDALY